jgi:DNA-binding winged helix-turn-helix (wHTH) protein
MSKFRKHLLIFGDFRLDVVEHLLYKQTGEVVPLKPKAVETLELLVIERGRLLTKAELLKRLWPDVLVDESNSEKFWV